MRLVSDKPAVKAEILKLQAVLNKMIEEDDFSNYDRLYEISKQLDTLIVQFYGKTSVIATIDIK